MNQQSILELAFLAIIILAIYFWFKKPTPKPSRSPRYHYHIKSHIMTAREEEAYRKLVKVFEQKFYIIPQVHLDTLFDFKLHGQNWYGAFQHINRKSVDYVLLNKQTLRPVCAVELDDSTHAREHRQKRDREVERIFKEANFPLVRLNSITNLSSSEIIDRFAKVINS